MKIAITSKGNTVDSPVDPRFGRAAGFMVCDIDTGECAYKDNAQNLSASQGAGIQSAKNVADSGVSAIVTGHCGPKAFSALKAAGIKIYTGAEGTVAENIEKFKAGSVKEIDNADVEGHWS
ncbi:MAG TPA: NifB/NifX family molybdenum-iron cluster-binding protein [bacterium]|nr:MAG: Dinitrogenase iron-molybdenum cofactor [bacterium ADurb.Bin236]HOY63152.1 NifB/NifX family molybdenum-iron cluster-binding protein [bacterium]HPI75702.1 NifB/NifX family molybdenum-iron cluster-binding protein [bacterium]HPN94353.1 NifB/NifX family molybdenum-iron cluster-binding protein [bacterium]